MKAIMAETYQPLYSMRRNLSYQALLLVPLVLLALVLAACGNLPQPFERVERNNEIVESILSNTGVMIAPVIDVPPPINLQLAEQVASAAQERDLAAVTRGANRNAKLLRGFASTNINEEGNTVIRINWELSGPDGILLGKTSTQAKAFTPTADDPWLLYANSDLTEIVSSTADFLVDAIHNTSGKIGVDAQQIDESLIATSPYHLFVRPVEGAPGSGSRSLTDAMNELLGADGIPIPIQVDSNPNEYAYVISGRVSTSPIDDRIESIMLVWELTLPDGQVLGSVNQENVIPRGSLDGDWGEIAFDAAAAAADGLMSVLLQVDPLGPKSSN